MTQVGKIEFGNSFDQCKSVQIKLVPDWMIINAVRHVIGRHSSQVITTCEWLVSNWDWLSTDCKNTITKDVENTFKLYNHWKKAIKIISQYPEYCPLGSQCDINDWNRVRKL